MPFLNYLSCLLIYLSCLFLYRYYHLFVELTCCVQARARRRARALLSPQRMITYSSLWAPSTGLYYGLHVPFIPSSLHILISSSLHLLIPSSPHPFIPSSPHPLNPSYPHLLIPSTLHILISSSPHPPYSHPLMSSNRNESPSSFSHVRFLLWHSQHSIVSIIPVFSRFPLLLSSTDSQILFTYIFISLLKNSYLYNIRMTAASTMELLRPADKPQLSKEKELQLSGSGAGEGARAWRPPLLRTSRMLYSQVSFSLLHYSGFSIPCR